LHLNLILQGLTGLLQSPIRGAEKHGLPGVISGNAIWRGLCKQLLLFVTLTYCVSVLQV
jgi:hypothetical protein